MASGATGQGQDERLARLAGGGLQRSIAADVWPDGAILSCTKCRFARRITTAEAGDYLRGGWPMHCGRTMSVEKAAPVSGSPL